MPKIIPIRDLKNTSAISEMCHQSDEPIYVTKNGYGDMVVMSMERYERTLLRYEIEKKLAESERDIENGDYSDANEFLLELKKEYGL